MTSSYRGVRPDDHAREESRTWPPIRHELPDYSDFTQDLIEHTQDLLCVHDLEGRLLAVNPGPARVLGYTVEELLRIPMRELIVPQYRPAFDEYLQTIARDGEARGLMAVLTRSGEERIWEYHNTLRREGVPTPVVRGLAHDVTERVLAEKELREAIKILTQTAHNQERTEAALRASEGRFRAVYERAPVGIKLVDSNSGRFLQANPKFCEIVGRSEEELRQLRFQDITHPDDVTPNEEWFKRLREQDAGSYEIDKRYIRRDGRVVWANVNVVLMSKEGREPWEMAIVRDITEARMAEDALRESEERLRLAQEVAGIGSFDRNFVTGQAGWTPQMEVIFGLPPGGFPRTVDAFLQLVHPEDRPQVSQLVAESMESGEGHAEWRIVRPDGSVRWISGRWKVFKDASGRPERLIGADYDITERKQIEQELRRAQERLTEEKLYLEQEIDTELGFEEILGQSEALKAVTESVSKVAATDATVLLLGETGTGKELVARAIHRLSRRSGNAFIKLNCAAIPSGLMESELFGHEKGAFTGAVARKIGRLELADRGTLFLDEIGEIPLMLQPKLLRVLQDMEFERLGGTQTIRVNFRLVAATNRDLAEGIRENEFRRDLYYRLNVFPIRVPRLRDRCEDIGVLAEHFVQKFARRMNKKIMSIPRKTMDALMQWDWPGNVRELENFIERSVILTHGSVLVAPLSELGVSKEVTVNETLEAAEREHILRALRETRGRISGPRGAAERLGLKRTTLQSKMKQMGIARRVVDEN